MTAFYKNKKTTKGQKTMKRLFDLHEDLVEQLKDYATTERVSQRYVIEKALIMYLKKIGYKKPQKTIQNQIPKGQITLKL